MTLEMKADLGGPPVASSVIRRRVASPKVGSVSRTAAMMWLVQVMMSASVESRRYQSVRMPDCDAKSASRVVLP